MELSRLLNPSLFDLVNSEDRSLHEFESFFMSLGLIKKGRPLEEICSG
ncbi:hypothetical protein SynBIOSE41_01015 [Synechococcus sp. BIOS-E4-1]|nr:hypothetical protein SynBIOSE41_01015 [Synechococcus sp. BIOS-E4-1]